MKLGELDFSNHPHPKPVAGQMIGTVLVEGTTTLAYARGSIKRSQTVSFYAHAWQGLGGNAANTQASLQYLCKQAEELAGNRDYNPVFMQWTASSDPAVITNLADSHDGWYVLESFAPDYEQFMVGGLGVLTRMIVTWVAPAPPSSLAMGYSGGALTTTYSGASQIAVGYPSAATNQAATAVTRTGGDGSIPVSVAPSASLNPLPFTPSATLGALYQGGVRVFDSIG